MLLHASEPAAFTSFVALNPALAPFNNPIARHAVAYAIPGDPTIAKIIKSEAPRCVFVPANFPGSSRTCVYRRDVATAQRLVRESGTRGDRVNIYQWNTDIGPALARALARILDRIGYRASVRLASGSSYGSHWPVSWKRPENATALYWASDFFAASQYYEPLLGCHAGMNSLFGVCNHAIDAVAKQALHAQVTDAGDAQRLWQRVNRMVLRDARVIPTGGLPGDATLISRTTRNSVPDTYAMGLPDLDQLWVR